MSSDTQPSELDALRDRATLAALPFNELIALKARLAWLTMARPNQLVDEEDPDWNIQLFLAGRGYGKTRLAAEDTWWWSWRNPETLTHVIAPTHGDIERVCFGGESGLLNVIPQDLIKDYNKSNQILTLVNDAKIIGFSAENPERLRGPQCHRLWADEVAAWDQPAGNAQRAFDMAIFGLRLGRRARAVLTTTPKPIKLVRSLVARRDVNIVRGSTYDNINNLSDNFKQQVLQYEGTRLGRQEIYGELLEPEESGILQRSWFPLWPAEMKLPRFEYIVMSLDTAFTEKSQSPSQMDRRTKEPDPTACVVLGVWKDSLNAPRKAMLLDCWHEWLDFTDLLERAREEARMEYGAKPRPPDVILIEDKGSGRSLQQVMRKNDLRVQVYNPTIDKLSRLHAVSHLVRHGLIYLPESSARRGKPRDWVQPFLDQVCVFHGEGTTEHDDYVDALTQALALLRDKQLLQVDWADIVPVDKAIARENIKVLRPRNKYAERIIQ